MSYTFIDDNGYRDRAFDGDGGVVCSVQFVVTVSDFRFGDKVRWNETNVCPAYFAVNLSLDVRGVR